MQQLLKKSWDKNRYLILGSGIILIFLILVTVAYKSDQKIVNQVVKGLTPPMPSFEIDSQSMADLLEYMHSLN